MKINEFLIQKGLSLVDRDAGHLGKMLNRDAGHVIRDIEEREPGI